MNKTALAFLWHMHQPLYRLRGERSCFMPWVRLHAIRSYYDMVRLLDEYPSVRITMNLVPILLDQIHDYLEGQRDRFMDVALLSPQALGENDRAFIFKHFFSAHPKTMVGVFPRYAQLLENRDHAITKKGEKDAWKEFSHADYMDLKVLFDLSWFGFSARKDFPVIQTLIEKGSAFDQEDVLAIFEVEKEILKRLFPLVRKASERGQLEISTSPYAHPILPLLVNSESAREGLPDATLPKGYSYPEDAIRQVQDGLETVEKHLGIKPIGMWPSEGSVSHELVQHLSSSGIRWVASDEEVLSRSLREDEFNPRHPWKISTHNETCALVFRDRELSNCIGFDYAAKDAQWAVDDFLGRVNKRLEKSTQGDMILVALDGENPWEFYPHAGHDFLCKLYAALQDHSHYVTTTVSEALNQCKKTGKLKHLHAGSWISAHFGTWTGGREKNQAWEFLAQAREDLKEALESEASSKEVWESLRAAQGSDWFWWMDEQFTTAHRAYFEALFRGHLRQAYEKAKRACPPFLQKTLLLKGSPMYTTMEEYS